MISQKKIRRKQNLCIFVRKASNTGCVFGEGEGNRTCKGSEEGACMAYSVDEEEANEFQVQPKKQNQREKSSPGFV
jgi:hypothetical protein